MKKEKDNYRQLYLVPVQHLVLHSGEISRTKVLKIYNKFNWKKFKAIPVYQDGYNCYNTDGNHRITALKWRGFKHVPCVFISKEEYEYLKSDPKNIIDIVVIHADAPILYKYKKEVVVTI